MFNLEKLLKKGFEQAFSRALEQTVQSKAEALFKKTSADGAPLSKKLEEKIEQGFQHFLEEGIRWGKRKPGLKNENSFPRGKSFS